MTQMTLPEMAGRFSPESWLAKRREHFKQASTTLSSGHFVYANPRIAWGFQVSVYLHARDDAVNLVGFQSIGHLLWLYQRVLPLLPSHIKPDPRLVSVSPLSSNCIATSILQHFITSTNQRSSCSSCRLHHGATQRFRATPTCFICAPRQPQKKTSVSTTCLHHNHLYELA